MAKYLKDNHYDNESETQQVVSFGDIESIILKEKTKKEEILNFIKANFESKSIYEFIINNDIEDMNMRKELSKLAFQEIGISNADKFEKFIDSLFKK